MPKTLKDLWEEIHIPFVESTLDWFAAVEFVSTSPQMGVKSAGTFMQNKGTILMALTAASIPFEEVRPAIWQRALGIPPKKKTESRTVHKNRLKQKAQQLFPKVKVTLAIADALLIAEWLRRERQGF